MTNDWQVSPKLVQVFVTILLALGAAPATAPAREAPREAPREVTREATREAIMVFGDSLSAGFGMAANQAWPALLDARLAREQRGFRIINASISGETTDCGLARIDDALERHRPALVAIELGANDALRGLPLSRMRANLAGMIERSQAAGATVLLIGMQMPPNFGAEFTRAFANMYASLADETGATLLPFLLQPIAADRDAFMDDNLHPTVAAQPAIAEHVWQSLAPMLAARPIGVGAVAQ